MVIRPTVVLAAAPLPVPQGRTMARALTAPLSPVGWPTIRSASCPLTALWATCPTTIPLTTCPLLILSMTCPLLLTVKACRLWCANTRSGCVVRRWRGMRSCGRGGSTRTRGLAWTRGRVGGWARALVALVVLVVVAVSVGAYVVFLRGEPDYGMSHGYQVQSDGSLKRPSTPVHQPDAPAELLRFNDDASEIAATHYFEVVAYAWNTGDTQYLRAFSSPDCQFCKKTAEEIERLYTEGGWGSGAAYSNMATEMLGKSEDAATFGDQSYGVRVRYHERTPDLYHDHSFQQSRESDNNLIVIVHWDGQRWLIRDIGKEGDE